MFECETKLDLTASQKLLTAFIATMKLNTLLIDLETLDGESLALFSALSLPCQVRSKSVYMGVLNMFALK